VSDEPERVRLPPALQAYRRGVDFDSSDLIAIVAIVAGAFVTMGSPYLTSRIDRKRRFDEGRADASVTYISLEAGVHQRSLDGLNPTPHNIAESQIATAKLIAYGSEDVRSMFMSLEKARKVGADPGVQFEERQRLYDQIRRELRNPDPVDHPSHRAQ
jgi:hypothetical protein